jgi:Rps23 Pro-64 3,4-dihydroxylase Tpa1-like proline 4-hydroxylase
MELTFRTIAENALGIKLETQRLYFNGQSHGQCGNMHQDTWGDDDNEYITMVYYVNETWKPEWGGFTLIMQDSNVHVVYPKPNSAVIFNSRLYHVGLEPTIHCTGMRITLAQKFKIVRD